MFTIIRSGSEARFSLNGRVVRVCAKFNNYSDNRFGTCNVRSANWTVKIEFNGHRGRAASFKFNIGEGNSGYDTYIDFADFAECIMGDARTVNDYTNFNDWVGEFGYTDLEAGRKAWDGCNDTNRKLNRVFSLHRGEFNRQAEGRDW